MDTLEQLPNAANGRCDQSSEIAKSSSDQNSTQGEHGGSKHGASREQVALASKSFPWIRRAGWCLINVWLIFHLMGIFLPAASVEPSPDFLRSAFWTFRFYPQLLFMDHGYHFFSPDPGDSTLVRYVAKSKDQPHRRGRYPHKQIWPRLLYHRYFMLTEAVPRYAEVESRLFELQAQAYAKRIAESHQAESVELFRVTHHMTAANSFRAGRSLNDPESLDEERIGEFSWPDTSR